MAMFRAFKPEGLNKIAKAMGYQGDMKEFGTFLEENPDKQEQMQRYTNTAMRMAQGGLAFQQGGTAPARGQEGSNPPRLELTNPAMPRPVNIPTQQINNPNFNPLPQQFTPQQGYTAGSSIGDISAQMVTNPSLPQGSAQIAQGTQMEQQQFVDPRSGQVVGGIALPTALAATAQAGQQTRTQAQQFTPEQATGQINTA